jgi:antitoxin ParD1/3/4
MSSNLQLSLTDELRRFVDTRASENKLYATPSEYISDLIRRDMENEAVMAKIHRGLDDIKHSRFVKESVLDIMEDYR